MMNWNWMTCRGAVSGLLAMMVLGGGLKVAAGEWVKLLDGQSVDQWRGFKQENFPKGSWELDDGVLRAVPGATAVDLVTREEYDNFELELEWKVSPGGNSGVFYHVSEEFDQVWHSAPEYQLLDDGGHPDGRNPKTSAGSLYALLAPNERKELKPVGEWNTTRIVVRGDRVQHWLNGEQVLSYRLGSPRLRELIEGSKFAPLKGFMKQAKGHVALQHHGEEVWFRNVRIRELSGEARQEGAMNRLTPRERAAGWELLFDGKSTDQWRAFGGENFPAEGWVVEDGLFKLKEGAGGGDIVTRDEYQDFVFAWEWRIEPGGNNGVKYFVIEERGRAIGHEYQMIDDSVVKAGKGSTASFYDVLAPAEEKPLRRPGQWNRSRIVARGNHVEHWLNGKKVLEYEMGSEQLREAIADSKFRDVEQFGTSVSGHILLTDHNDRCAFRNLKVRRLKTGDGTGKE